MLARVRFAGRACARPLLRSWSNARPAAPWRPAATAATIGCLAGGAVLAAGALWRPEDAAAAATGPSAGQFSINFISDAYEKILPSVVSITVVQGPVGGVGTGFIIDPRGLVVTNAHVVMGHARIMVVLSDGREFSARVHSIDEWSDVALLELQDVPGPLPVARIGTSGKLRPGEWVLAVGSPFFLEKTVTAGIVSAAPRHSSELGLRNRNAEYIQTDAAVNQGNSGGPLVNVNGEVVGIATMKVEDAGGISFAVAIDHAMEVVKQLQKHGRVSRPFVGMTIVSLDTTTMALERAHNPVFPNVSSGVLITRVIPGSPAEQAGLEIGDVIVELDGKPVRTQVDILRALGFKVGHTFSMTVARRGGKQFTTKLQAVEARW